MLDTRGSKNDGSMSNNLTIRVGDMQALDASPSAVFTEMLAKHELPGYHSPFSAITGYVSQHQHAFSTCSEIDNFFGTRS